MVILPPTAKVRYENQRPDGGTIILEDWRTNAARLCDPDQALLKTELQDSGLKLHLEHRSGAHAPPEKIDLEILWPNNTRSARIAFAFPAQGVRAFDGDGMEIPLDGWLQVNRLTGSRILASGYANLELRLMPRRPRDGLWGNEFAYPRPLPTIAHQWRHEIRLPDFREEIEGLLATSDLLDAWVEVAIIHLGQPLYRVRVSRYLCPLSKLSRDVCLSQSAIRQLRSETLEQLPIHALRLEASGEEPLSLEPNLSQSVANGSWRFDPQSREPGSWLIYPGKTATEQIRPLLWPIDGEAPGNSPLTRALAIADRHKRAEALDEVITAMAADYLEPCWPELERLIEQLGHLPLSALDLWRRLAHSPDAMAALVFRMGNLEQSFVDRFTVELPFVWQTIPYETWKHACIRLRKQCEADFGEQHARTEAVKKIHDQIQWLVDQCPELEKLLRGVQSHTTDKQFPELCTLRHLASEDRPPQKMPKRPNFLDTT
jgi:hypothetical protein